jgi:hypothetical protein
MPDGYRGVGIQAGQGGSSSQRKSFTSLGGTMTYFRIFSSFYTSTWRDFAVVLVDHRIGFIDWGSTLLFLRNLVFLSQTYRASPASALASLDLCTNTFGAVIPLVPDGQFVNLGVGWGCTPLGSISILLVPIPFTLYKVRTSVSSAIRMLTKLSVSTVLPYVHGRS